MIAFFLRTFFSKKVLQERLRSCTLTKNFLTMGETWNFARFSILARMLESRACIG